MRIRTSHIASMVKMTLIRANLILCLMCALFSQPSSSSSVQLTSSNLDEVLNGNELVFVNFYADWCRFSQTLAPVFEEAAKQIAASYPQPGKVVLAKVDCDKENSISQKFHVSKYPTLKIFRFGSVVKKEYRGQRSKQAIVEFISKQLENLIKVLPTLDDLDNIDEKKRSIIGYFDDDKGVDYQAYEKLAGILRDDCKFYAVVGPESERERTVGNRIAYREPGSETEVPFSGQLTDENYVKIWAQDKCVPIVREITFENAEELTEEGLPFLILFHNVDDKETPQRFTELVTKDLVSERASINCLTADGAKFSHPLYHLGKTSADLPVLAIDSFRHMYMWPHNPKTDFGNAQLLKTFIADLHSGKLHREFHHGPDPTTKQAQIAKDDKHIPHGDDDNAKPPQPTTPPESTFVKLAPNSQRYSFQRDEL